MSRCLKAMIGESMDMQAQAQAMGYLSLAWGLGTILGKPHPHAHVHTIGCLCNSTFLTACDSDGVACGHCFGELTCVSLLACHAGLIYPQVGFVLF